MKDVVGVIAVVIVILYFVKVMVENAPFVGVFI